MVSAALHLDFGDARKFPADLVSILPVGGAELVEEDLLVEAQVCDLAFSWARVARVVDTGPFPVPRGAAAGGWAVDPWDLIRQPPAGGGLIDIQRAHFTALFGERHGDEPAVGGRHVPVH